MAYCGSSSSCVPSRLPSLLPSLFLLLVGLFQLLSSSAVAQGQQQSPFPSGPEKQAHIHFFFHDIQSGSNPTAIQVVTPPANAPGGFGSVEMVDNALTETVDRSSKLVGRAQGFYASASQTGTALLMTMNYVFVDGEFNGSTLAIVGRNPVMESVREMSIVGGSGRLRMARGYALAQTRSFGMGGDAVVEYDVYVVYYQDAGAGQVMTNTPGGASGGAGGRGSPSGVAGAPAASWNLVMTATLAVSWVLLLSTPRA